MRIKQVRAREILDSRGIPTVECCITLADETDIFACAPSGTSKGAFEALELRDAQERLAGLGVQQSVTIIETVIAPALIDKEPDVVAMDQIIHELDGTSDASHLGANSMIATSMAIARAQAYAYKMELFELFASLCESDLVSLPLPLFNVVEGGVHEKTNLAWQEILVIPQQATSFAHAIEAGLELWYRLCNLVQTEVPRITIGLEGGLSVSCQSLEQPLQWLTTVMEQLPQYTFTIGIDAAASQWYSKEQQLYTLDNKTVSAHELIAYYQDLVATYPISYLEDGLAQDDWQGWQALTATLGDTILIVGDDLYASSCDRIAYGIEHAISNGIIIKPNQVGTLTKTLQALLLAQEYSLNTIVSHRSGETEDTLIADLAVGTCAGYIKAGGFCRGERVSKYNRLLRIEDKLKGFAIESL